MAHVIQNSGHDDMIHDAVPDYYGRRLATCSADKTIRIFDITEEAHRLTETLKGHDQAVWCAAWAHPKYGTLLASCSYDGRILIWREQPPNTWTKIHDYAAHTASVNIVDWAPHESGCVLAGASSDGNISVLEFKDNAWASLMFPAHAMGANAVSWAPSVTPGAVVSASSSGLGQQQNGALRRFVSGGSDCLVKIWDWNSDSQSYSCVAELSGHSDWVRDVAWAPTILSKSYIASASQDKSVRIWSTSSANPTTADWTSTILPFDAVAWRVSWSPSGNVLAVSTGDNKVSLWKESLAGKWENIKTVDS